MRWEKLEIQGGRVHGHAEGEQGLAVGEISGPGMRWGHTCNAIKGGRFLYVFGGYGRDNCQTNQVHVFDTVGKTWSQPLIKGTPPIPRDSHSCTTVGDNLFVFGGTDGMNPLNDLHILDTSSHTWISPTIRGDGPQAREGHSAALVGKRLFIFGGGGKSSENHAEIYYNDVYVLNTETLVWKCAGTSGTLPSPRDSHSCSSWKNRIIVIGGEDKHDYYLSDVHILDTDTLIWRELNTSGQILPPRAGHSTVAFGKNLFVFGGFTDAQNLYNDLYMLDVDTGLWTRVATTGDGPSPRFSMAGDCLDPLKSGVLVFIGGCSKNLEALDDMYYLHTGFTRESQQRPEKLSLRKQLKLKCQEQNLNPAYNNALVMHNMGAQNMPSSQPLPPPGKKAFRAKVIESTPEGFTIETVIDGKPLRGILFLNKPISHVPAIYNTSRKRVAGEASGTVPNGVQNCKWKTSKVLKQYGMEDRLADNVHASNSALHELQTRAITDLNSNAAATFDTSRLLQVSYEKPPVASLSQDDQKHGASLCTTANPKDDKPNIVISSGAESQRDHQSSYAQMCNTEVLNPTSVKSPAYSSPNQDPSRVVCSDPVKST